MAHCRTTTTKTFSYGHQSRLLAAPLATFRIALAAFGHVVRSGTGCPTSDQEVASITVRQDLSDSAYSDAYQRMVVSSLDRAQQWTRLEPVRA